MDSGQRRYCSEWTPGKSGCGVLSVSQRTIRRAIARDRTILTNGVTTRDQADLNVLGGEASRRNPLIARAVDQGGHDLVEHDPIGHALPVTAERMARCDGRVDRPQRRELFPDGVEPAYWDDRHGILRGSQRQPHLHDPPSRACVSPIAGRSKGKAKRRTPGLGVRRFSLLPVT